MTDAAPAKRRGPAKKGAPRKAAAKKAPADADHPAEDAAEAAPARRAAPSEAKQKAPVERTRLVFPRALYEPQKDEVKAPFKAHGLKWQFLGEGKGRYHKEGVNVFVQFTEEGVDYTVWGDDRATVDAILDAWRVLAGDARFASLLVKGEEAKEKEVAQKESEEMRLWKLQEPQRRPGEPDFFFHRRREEWMAKKPA